MAESLLVNKSLQYKAEAMVRWRLRQTDPSWRGEFPERDWKAIAKNILAAKQDYRASIDRWAERKFSKRGAA